MKKNCDNCKYFEQTDDELGTGFCIAEKQYCEFRYKNETCDIFKKDDRQYFKHN